MVLPLLEFLHRTVQPSTVVPDTFLQSRISEPVFKQSHIISFVKLNSTMPLSFNHVAGMWAYAPSSGNISIPNAQQQKPYRRTSSQSSTSSTDTVMPTAAAAPAADGSKTGKKVKRSRWCW